MDRPMTTPAWSSSHGSGRPSRLVFGLVALSAVVGFVSDLSLVSVVGVATSGGVTPFLRESGWYAYGVILGTLAAGVVSAVLGFVLVAKKRAPAALLAVLPLLLAVLVWRLQVAAVDLVRQAIGGVSLDPGQKARIFAVGIAEASTLGIAGGAILSSLAATLAGYLGARALSRVPRGRFGLGAVLALVGGLVGLAVVGALSVAWPAFAASGPPLGLAAALAGVFAAVVGGVALSDPSADDEARGSALGDVGLAALFAAVGVLFAVTALRGIGQHQALTAVGNHSLDAARQQQLVAQGLARSEAASSVHWLPLVPIVLASLGVLVPSIRLSGRALASAWSGVLAGLVASTLALGVFVVPRDRPLQDLAALARAADGASGLVVGPESITHGGVEIGRTMELTPERCQELGASAVSPDPRVPTVAIDPAVPFGRVGCLLGAMAGDEGRSIEIAHTGGTKSDLPPPWGTMIRGPKGYRLRVAEALRAREPKHLHIARASWRARIEDRVSSLEGPFDERMSEIRSVQPGARLGLSVDPDVPFGEVSRLLEALEGRDVELFPTMTGERAMATSDLATLLETMKLDTLAVRSSSTPGRRDRVRLGAVNVSGRLPLEVVERAVRGYARAFDACYEGGFTKKPTLEGRVAVRLVVLGDGSVKEARNGGSDLPDPAVVDCVVGVFQRALFPKPEGGIVTIVVPLLFSPRG